MKTIALQNGILELEPKLKAYAYKLTTNADNASDLVQETLLKAMTHPEYFKENTNLSAWMHTIMKNIFINNYRRSKKIQLLHDDNPTYNVITNMKSKTSNPENEFRLLELRNGINKLNDDLKTPIQMHLEGYKYKEIAKALDIPEGTVKFRIFTAKNELKGKIRA